MSDQDRAYGRIAPDFVRKVATNDQQSIEVTDTMPAQRWNEYRRLHKAGRIHLGLSRDEAGDVFIMVESEGLLDRGHASGYLFCQPHPPEPIEQERRFEPCRGLATRGVHPYDGGSEGYSFQKVTEHWFAFDQGPG